MKLQFSKIQTPNFVRCKQGFVSISELSENDIERYSDLWKSEIISKWKDRKDALNVEGEKK